MTCTCPSQKKKSDVHVAYTIINIPNCLILMSNNIIRPSRLLFKIHSYHVIIFLFLSISCLLSLSHILFHLLSVSLSSTKEVILLINYRSNSIPLSLSIPSIPLNFSPHSLSPRPSPRKTLRLKLP